MSKAEQIAEAFIAIASVNHYLVGFKGSDVTWEELAQAQQILITRDNETGNTFATLSLALDLIELELKGK